MKKFALALMVSAAGLFGMAPGASAYPPAAPTVSVQTPSLAPGGTTPVTLNGCPAGATAQVTLNGVTTTGTADASGSATVTVTAPSTAGTFTGSASCGGASTPFTITVLAPATPPGGLPATGSDGIGATTGIAAGLLAIGLGLFGVSMVRRRQATAA